MRFGDKLSLALEDLGSPSIKRAESHLMRCRKCKQPVSRDELHDGVCSQCVIGEANMADVGSSALGVDYPGGTEDQSNDPTDMLSALDRSDLKTMENEQNKDKPEQQQQVADQSKWKPLEQKRFQLQQKLDAAKTKFDATKDPRDAEEMVRLSDQVKAAEEAENRTKFPNMPPEATASGI